MAFVEKHLPDPFFLEKDIRISLRDKIFREVVGNTLIHREYLNAYPARLIIEKDKVIIDNWNKPRTGGILTPKNIIPYPKNPNLANFFKLIGRADELGSGIRNTYAYSHHYSDGLHPKFIEGDNFKTIIPLPTIFNQKNEPLILSEPAIRYEKKATKPKNEPINQKNEPLNEPINQENEPLKILLNEIPQKISATKTKRLITILHLILNNQGTNIPTIENLPSTSRATARETVTHIAERCSNY